MVAVPQIQSWSVGAGGVTLSVATHRQMLVENSSATIAMTVAWNGSGSAWTLQPGSRIGFFLPGTVATITLTGVGGSADYQVLGQG